MYRICSGGSGHARSVSFQFHVLIVTVPLAVLESLSGIVVTRSDRLIWFEVTVCAVFSCWFHGIVDGNVFPIDACFSYFVSD